MPICSGLRRSKSEGFPRKVVDATRIRPALCLVTIQLAFACGLVGVTGCNAPERSTGPPQVSPVSEVTRETPDPGDSNVGHPTSEDENVLTPMGPADFEVNFATDFGPVFGPPTARPAPVCEIQSCGGRSFVFLTGAYGQDPPKSWTVGDTDLHVHKSLPEDKRHFEYSAIWPKQRKVVRLVRIPDDAGQIVIQDLDGGTEQVLDPLIPTPIPSGISIASRSHVLMVTGLGMHRVWRFEQDPTYCEFGNARGHISTAIHPDGRWFVEGGRPREIRSTRSGRVRMEFAKESPVDRVIEVAFSPTGKYLAIQGTDEVYLGDTRNQINAWRSAKFRERLQLWDYMSRQAILDISGRLGGHKQAIRSVAVSNSERFLVWVNSDNIISTCTIHKDAKPVHRQLNFAVHGGIAISEDDQFVVLGSENELKAFKLNRLISLPE